MDDKQKNRIYKRVQKHFTERRTPEEQRELRMRTGMRKAGQRVRKRRPADFDDDEVAGMENMGRRRKSPAPNAPRGDGQQARGVLSRPDPHDPRKELVIATGIDVAVVVVTLRTPPLRPGLIDRFLVALERGGVDPLICANKLDMHDEDERAALRAALAPYAALEVPVVYCSAAEGEGIDALRSALRGKTCAFVGHSGVGKSSLLNALDEGGRRTGTVRSSDGRGRHTTTTTTFTTIGDDTRVLDTPGVRGFGLWRMDRDQLRGAFPELEALAAGCRFGDCAHVHEPDCAVRDAVAAGEVAEVRYASYLRIRDSLDA